MIIFLCLLPYRYISKINIVVVLITLFFYILALLSYLLNGGVNIVAVLSKFGGTGLFGVLLALCWPVARDNIATSKYIFLGIFIINLIFFYGFFTKDSLGLSSVGGGNYQEAAYVAILLLLLNLYFSKEYSSFRKVGFIITLFYVYVVLTSGARGPLATLFVLALLYVRPRNIFFLSTPIVVLLGLSFESVGMQRVMAIFDLSISTSGDFFNVFSSGRVDINLALIQALQYSPFIGLGLESIETHGGVVHGFFLEPIINFGLIAGSVFLILIGLALSVALNERHQLSSILLFYSLAMLAFSGSIWSEPVFLFSFILSLRNIINVKEA